MFNLVVVRATIITMIIINYSFFTTNLVLKYEGSPTINIRGLPNTNHL